MQDNKLYAVRVTYRDGSSTVFGPVRSREEARRLLGQVVGPTSTGTIMRWNAPDTGVGGVLSARPAPPAVPQAPEEPEGPEPTWSGEAQGAIVNGLPEYMFIDVFGRDDSANLIDPELTDIRVWGNDGASPVGTGVVENPITDAYYENYIRTQSGAFQNFGLQYPNITMVELLNAQGDVQQALEPAVFDNDWANAYNSGQASSPDVEQVTVSFSGTAIDSLMAIRLQSGSTFHGDGPDNWFDQVVDSGPTHKTFATPGASGFQNDILWLIHDSGFVYRVGETFTVS